MKTEKRIPHVGVQLLASIDDTVVDMWLRLSQNNRQLAKYDISGIQTKNGEMREYYAGISFNTVFDSATGRLVINQSENVEKDGEDVLKKFRNVYNINNGARWCIEQKKISDKAFYCELYNSIANYVSSLFTAEFVEDGSWMQVVMKGPSLNVAQFFADFDNRFNTQATTTKRRNTGFPDAIVVQFQRRYYVDKMPVFLTDFTYLPLAQFTSASRQRETFHVDPEPIVGGYEVGSASRLLDR